MKDQWQVTIYTYVRDSFGLNDKQLQQIVNNARLAASILSDTCAKGEMIFDLEPEAFFLTGTVPVQTIDCLTP